MPGLSTPFCDVLGIDYPVAQAPIGSLTCPDLAAAVSNAGGLGTLAVTWRDPDETREAIERTRGRTDRPFAVNLVLDERTVEWPVEEHLVACLDAGAPIVSFSFGDPTPHLDRCQDAGVPVIAMVGSAGAAKSAVAAGVDVVVAQGAEAGGHLDSDESTMALVPCVVDAVPEVPVLAAGGIGDGRGVAASLALGADGAWLGTRFVATAEASAHREYKAAVVAARETDTVRSTLFDGGWPGRDHRTLVTDTVAEWDAAGRPPPGERPGEGDAVASLPDGTTVERFDDVPPVAGVTGDPDSLPQYAGQSAGTTDAIRPASEVVTSLVQEAASTIEGAADALGQDR